MSRGKMRYRSKEIDPVIYRYLASNFNIDFLSLKKCWLCRKRILSDDVVLI